MIDPRNISGRSPVRKSDAVVGVELDGEAVLLHQQDETLHVLSQAATIIWNLIDDHSTLDSIAEELSEVFQVDLERMRRDVVGAAQDFGARGLLEGVLGDPSLAAQNAVPQVPQRGPHD